MEFYEVMGTIAGSVLALFQALKAKKAPALYAIVTSMARHYGKEEGETINEQLVWSYSVVLPQSSWFHNLTWHYQLAHKVHASSMAELITPNLAYQYMLFVQSFPV